MTVQEKFEQYWGALTKDLPPGLIDFQKDSHNAAYLFAAKEAREDAIRECAKIVELFEVGDKDEVYKATVDIHNGILALLENAMSETKLPPLDVTQEQCGALMQEELRCCLHKPHEGGHQWNSDWKQPVNPELTAALEREEKLKEMNRELAEVNTELQKLVDEACTAGENTEAKFAALQAAARDYLVGGDADLAMALRGLLEGK